MPSRSRDTPAITMRSPVDKPSTTRKPDEVAFVVTTFCFFSLYCFHQQAIRIFQQDQ